MSWFWYNFDFIKLFTNKYRIFCISLFLFTCTNKISSYPIPNPIPNQITKPILAPSWANAALYLKLLEINGPEPYTVQAKMNTIKRCIKAHVSVRTHMHMYT